MVKRILQGYKLVKCYEGERLDNEKYSKGV